jgi:hypothetical protein
MYTIMTLRNPKEKHKNNHHTRQCYAEVGKTVINYITNPFYFLSFQFLSFGFHLEEIFNFGIRSEKKYTNQFIIFPM